MSLPGMLTWDGVQLIVNDSVPDQTWIGMTTADNTNGFSMWPQSPISVPEVQPNIDWNKFYEMLDLPQRKEPEPDIPMAPRTNKRRIRLRD